MSVTIAELKEHLRITWTTEDAILGVYLGAAINYLEAYTGQILDRGNRTTYFEKFGDLELIGDSPDSVVVSYIDTDGVTQALKPSTYDLKEHKARPYLTLAYSQSWPSVLSVDAPINVTYQSGYSTGTLPDTLKAAILIEAATQYEFRENESIIKLQSRKTVERLSMPYRVYTL